MFFMQIFLSQLLLCSLNTNGNCVLLENNCHLKVNIIVMPLPNSKVKPQKKIQKQNIKSTSNYAMSYKHLHQTSTNHLASAAKQYQQQGLLFLSHKSYLNLNKLSKTLKYISCNLLSDTIVFVVVVVIWFVSFKNIKTFDVGGRHLMNFFSNK